MNKTFPIELSEDLHKKLKIAAIHDGLTLHDWIVKTLEEKVGNEEMGATHGLKREGSHERNRNR
jgi:hypothetical protein